MAAITVLTFATQSEVASTENPGASVSAGSGAGLDVSASAICRLDIRCEADMGTEPQAEIYLDTAPASTGPWTEVFKKKMNSGEPPYSPHVWANSTRVVITPDNFVRARWKVQGTRRGAVALKLGVSGTVP